MPAYSKAVSSLLVTKLGLWSLFVLQLTQISFLPKKQFFFDICSVEVAQSRQNLFLNEAWVNCGTHKRRNPKLVTRGEPYDPIFVAILWKNQSYRWCLILSLNVPKKSKIKFVSLYVLNWAVLILCEKILPETSGT